MASSPFIIDQAYAQTVIDVGETQPCFMNYTAGSQMWKNCDFQGDPVGATMLGFEWVTGGLFSMIVVALIVIMVYIKYHTVIYPIAIGIIMLPTSYFLFPDIFLSFALIMAGVGIAALIYGIIVLRTRD
tara:strand:+ start:5693 stop:6079 length:387 start_codon:yes stop_codon:yes gene_type:complete